MSAHKMWWQKSGTNIREQWKIHWKTNVIFASVVSFCFPFNDTFAPKPPKIPNTLNNNSSSSSGSEPQKSVPIYVEFLSFSLAFAGHLVENDHYVILGRGEKPQFNHRSMHDRVYVCAQQLDTYRSTQSWHIHRCDARISNHTNATAEPHSEAERPQWKPLEPDERI